MTSPLEPPPHRPRVSTPVRLLSIPVVILLVLGGGWVTGAVLTNDFILSMVLTAAWMGALGIACVILVVKRRELWPALATFAVVATATGAYLGAETILDDKVNEDVVTADAVAAEPAPAADAAPATEPEPQPKPKPKGNVLLHRGDFASLAHNTKGVAQVIELPDGKRILTLTEFKTDAGPDLRLYLSSGNVDQGSAGDKFKDLGALKGNIGNQQYEIPKGTDLAEYTRVLVWCRAFSVGFGTADLSSD
jgi:hypothetical protein